MKKKKKPKKGCQFSIIKIVTFGAADFHEKKQKWVKIFVILIKSIFKEAKGKKMISQRRKSQQNKTECLYEKGKEKFNGCFATKIFPHLA